MGFVFGGECFSHFVWGAFIDWVSSLGCSVFQSIASPNHEQSRTLGLLVGFSISLFWGGGVFNLGFLLTIIVWFWGL